MKKSILVLLVTLMFFVGCAATFPSLANGETEQGDSEYLMDESELSDKSKDLLTVKGEPEKEIYRKENVEPGEEQEEQPSIQPPRVGKPNINTER